MIEILINFKDTYGMARKNVKHNIDIYIKSKINSNTCSYTYIKQQKSNQSKEHKICTKETKDESTFLISI